MKVKKWLAIDKKAGRKIDTARDLLKRYLSASLSPEDPSRRDAEKLLKQVGG